MKIIHTADWHIGRNICGISMLPDQRHFFQQFFTFLKQERPDAVIVAGDIYDRPIPSTEAMALLDDILSEIVLSLSIPVLAISGNHDSRERLDYEKNFLAKAGLHIAGRLASPVEQVTLTDENGPVCFTLLPFVDAAGVNTLFPEEPRIQGAAAAFARMVQTIPFNPAQRNVLICHGYFSQINAPLAGEDSLGGAELVSLSALPPFDYIAAGHIHRKMPLGPEARYSGSILQYSPNESGNTPSITIVDMEEKGKLSISEHFFQPLHKLRKVHGNFENLLLSPPSEDYIFAELADSEVILEPARRLKEIFPNLMGVSYIERQEIAGSPTEVPDRNASLTDLFDTFYQYVTKVELSPAGKQIVKEAADFIKEAAQ